jgi:competence protein ComEC
VWLDPTGARVVTDREARGDRPWVPGLPKPKQAPPSGLPPAEIDRGSEQDAQPPAAVAE